MKRLTVLYDPDCGFCRWVRDWLSGQRQLVHLDLVPAGSAQVRRAFPQLDHCRAPRQVTVVGDGGQVYVGTRAWIVVLWALDRYRPLALRLATPAMQPFARAAVAAAARFRAVTRDETAGIAAPAVNPGAAGDAPDRGDGRDGNVCSA